MEIWNNQMKTSGNKNNKKHITRYWVKDVLSLDIGDGCTTP